MQKRRSRLFFPRLFVVLVAAGCCECDDECETCEEIGPGSVSTVTLRHPLIFTSPGSQFAVKAVPINDDGVPVSRNDLSVDWSLTGIPGAVISPAYLDATIQIPTTPEVGQASFNTSVQGKSAVDPGRVQVGPSSSGPPGDYVSAPYSAGQPPVALLIDGAMNGADGSCINDHSVAVVAKATLDVNFTSGCVPEVLAFARGSSAQSILDPPPWSAASESLVNVSAGPPRSIVVFVRTHIASPSDEALSNVEEIANDIYDRNRTGIQFNWQDYTEDPAPPEVANLTFPRQCIGLEAILPIETSGHYNDLGLPEGDPAPEYGALPEHNVHVVFVKAIAEDGMGFHCARTPFRGPVIILSVAAFSETTLAHELAHALAMGSEEDPDHSGHVEAPDFTPANVMMAAGRCYAKARDHFSLGQAFRMNFDKRSWVERKDPTVQPRRVCPMTGLAGDCPGLSKDVGEGH